MKDLILNKNEILRYLILNKKLNISDYPPKIIIDFNDRKENNTTLIENTKSSLTHNNTIFTTQTFLNDFKEKTGMTFEEFLSKNNYLKIQDDKIIFKKKNNIPVSIYISSWLFKINYFLMLNDLDYTIFADKKIVNNMYDNFYFDGEIKAIDLETFNILNINFKNLLDSCEYNRYTNIHALNILFLITKFKYRKFYIPEYKYYLKMFLKSLKIHGIELIVDFEEFFKEHYQNIKNNKYFIKEEDSYFYIKNINKKFDNDFIIQSFNKINDYFFIKSAFEYNVIYYLKPIYIEDFTFPEFLIHKKFLKGL